MNYIPIAISSDNNYAPYVATLIVSILENTKSKIKFYIIDSGISIYSKNNILHLKNKYDFFIEFIDILQLRTNFKLPATPSGHITRASSDRFLIPLIDEKLDKIIVLDADMIALGDVSSLWEINIDNHILAAVPVYAWTHADSLYNHIKDTNMPNNHIYFNMGTILLNCKKWRDDKITEKISSFKIEFDTKVYSWWDEILLNIILSPNKYIAIDPKYNMMIPHQCYYKYNKPRQHKFIIEEYCKLSKEYKIQDIVFSHFAMKDTKPWNTNIYYYSPIKKWVDIPNFNEFWKYMKKTKFYKSEFIKFKKRKYSIYLNRIKVIVKYKLKDFFYFIRSCIAKICISYK